MRMALSLMAGSLLWSSCHVVPHYSLSRVSPHKDSLLVRIYLDGRQDAGVYRTIAENELERLLGTSAGRTVPLYEVRFEFLGRGVPRERFALLVTRLEEPALSAHATERPGAASLAVPRWETYLF